MRTLSGLYHFVIVVWKPKTAESRAHEKCYPRLAGEIFFSLSLGDPTQTNKTIL
jgi:hypothetical protein